MKVGLFGGSFNPPHIGHELVCLYLLETNKIDKIWIIPCAKHAFDKDLISLEHRFEMLTLATKIFSSRVLVSLVEQNFPDKSYSINTVQYFKKKYPHIEFEFIVGNDILKEMSSWKDFLKLKKIIKLNVINREGYEILKAKNEFQFPNISSSEIRQRIKEGKSVEHFLNRNVHEYIVKNKLYID